MILYIIDDKKNNISQYVYWNHISLYGYSLDNNGYQKVDNNINYKIWKLLKGKSLKYESKYNEYDVFIDEKNYRHFYKEKNENYELFLAMNGIDCVLETGEEKTNNKNFLVKKFIVGGLVIVINLAAFSSCQREMNVTLPISTVTVTDVSEEYSSEDIIDVNSAISLIEINNEVEILKNDLMLKTIFPFYIGTKMEYLIKERLTDISFEYYDFDEHDSLGYYDITRPNVLNIRKDKKESDFIKRHEYGHLLQDVSIDEHFIKEAMADIMTKEFYDCNANECGYYFIVRNMYMLGLIIGPEPFYQMVYSGNTELFYSSIRPYLSADEFEDFKEIICSDPKKVELNQILEQYIINIYKTKFGHDIVEDDFMMCLFTDLSFFERVFMFNPNKVHNDQEVQISDEVAPDIVSNLKNVIEKDGHYYIRINLYNKFNDQYQRIENKTYTEEYGKVLK